jgi:hypothetical protein
MKKINSTTIEINGSNIDFSREISKIIEFDKVYVIQTEAKDGEKIDDGFKTDRIFGISNKGEILWKKPGFKISKLKREKKIILPSGINQKDEYDLIIYVISIMLYVNPETGTIIKQEQIK